ncbi:T9SS type A sorting domain-containing protein, partial [Lishizhenia sp.]|uniref:T9SS type A sorting domain-containing protein n=1 Tax=Lishizhenia sp. TaxID=2497594 RepID=UPI00299D9AED
STQPISSIKLHNAMGQLVEFYFVNQSNFQFEVKDYDPGVYHLTVLNKDGSSNFRKLIIE